MLGTENIEKIGDALVDLIVAGKKISEDKKISIEDLPVAIGLISKAPKFTAAFESLSKAVDEAKDIDVGEFVALVQYVDKKVKEVEKA